MRRAALALVALLLSAQSHAFFSATGIRQGPETPRYLATMITLPNGSVLLAGGINIFGSPLNSAALYDPVKNTWTNAAGMNRFRYFHTATLLPNGKVLVAGGTDGLVPLGNAEIYDPSTNLWTMTGNMVAARYRHTATLVPATGKVIVAGGFSSGGTNSVEEYDPATNQWTARTSMGSSRYDHTATLLRDQTRILVTGGYDNNLPASPRNTAEIWNGTSWAATSNNMSTPHAQHAAIHYGNNGVLVFGGIGDNVGTASKKADVFNGTTFSATGDMPAPRVHFPSHMGQEATGGFATAFQDSISAKGEASASSEKPEESEIAVLDACTISCTKSANSTGFGQTSPCEIGFDTGASCLAAGSPRVCKSSAPANSAVVCSDTVYNHVFSIGGTLTNRSIEFGFDDEFQATASRITGSILSSSLTLTGLKIYTADGSTITTTGGGGDLDNRTKIVAGKLSANVPITGLTVTTVNFSADFCDNTTADCPDTLELEGQSDITGGAINIGSMVHSDYLYYVGPGWGYVTLGGNPDKPTELQSPTFYMNSARLSTGEIFRANGITDAGNASGNAEMTEFVSDLFSAGPSGTARQYHSATMLGNGTVLIAGGDTGSLPPSAPTNHAERINAAGTGLIATAAMNRARESHSATLLPDGRVLACGGYTAADWTTSVVHSTSTCELYDSGANTWTFAVAMTTPRANHTASLLFTGQVLITGGVDQNGAPLSFAEIYDIFLSTSFRTAPLNIARYQHTATVLTDGKVLIAGGRQVNPLGVSEVFDPSAQTWTMANMTQNRYLHSATFLPDGRVIAAGGLDLFGFPMKSSEIYDPAQNAWSNTGDMNSAHAGHAAILTPSGLVVASGGATLFDKNSATTTVETYSGGDWTVFFSSFSSQNNLGTLRSRHTMTFLNNGKILAVGGWTGSGVTNTSEYSYVVSTYSIASPAVFSLSVTTGTPPGTVITVTGNQLNGVVEDSGGLGYSNAASNTPRLVLRPHDSTTGGSQAGSSFLLDPSTTIYSASVPMSITNPDTGGSDSFRFTTPNTGCGYYQLGVAGGGVFSDFTQFRVQPQAVASSPTVVGTPLSTTQLKFNFPVTHASNYLVYPATEPGTIVLWTSSDTVVYNNLSTNTPVGIRARAENCISTSTLSLPVTVYTLAAAPSTTTIIAVSTYSATVTWNANGNPGGTAYMVQYSSLGFGGFGSECVLPARCVTSVGTSVEVTGLGAGENWTFSVRAANGDGVVTAFGPDAKALTQDDRPTGIVGVALGISSISWSWNALPWASGYNIYTATGGAPGIIASSSQTFFHHTGLSPNATAAIRVAGVQGAAVGPLSNSTATANTLAAPPVPTPAGVTSLTAAVSWTANGNPPGTVYELSYSTDNFNFSQTVALQFLAGHVGSSHTITGLTASTSYYFRMRAQNFAGLASAYSATVTTTTNIEVPTNLVGTALGVSSVSWTWTAVPYAETYDVFYATNVGATVPGVLVATNPVQFIHTGLGVNQPSQIVARARNVTFAVTGPLSPLSGTVFSHANPPSSPSVMSLSSTTITVSWAANGNPAGTTYVLATATNAAMNEGRIPDISTTNVNNVRITGLLSRTTYFMLVYANNGSNVPTTFSATTNTFTTAGGIIEAAVPRETDQTFSATLNSNRVVTMNVTAGTFDRAVLMRVEDSSRTLCGPIPAAVEIHVSPDQQPVEPLLFSLSFHASDVPGMDQKRLVLSRYDEVTGKCAALKSNLTVKGSTKSVTALLDHLSLYQITLSTPATTLSAVEAYPNPLRPSQAGQSFITFSNMPADTDVRLYTIRGELVWETIADAGGVAQWPGTNKAGRRVASGVYVVLLKKGDTTRTIKVAVER